MKMKKQELVAWITTQGGRITARDTMRRGPYFKTSEEAREALDGLVQDGLGTWAYLKPGPTGGHPTRVFVLTIPTNADDTPRNDAVGEVSVDMSRINEPQGKDGQL